MEDEVFWGYKISPITRKLRSGRWNVGCCIEYEHLGKPMIKQFFADDGISYILKVEAEKECFNFAQNLITKGLV